MQRITIPLGSWNKLQNKPKSNEILEEKKIDLLKHFILGESHLYKPNQATGEKDIVWHLAVFRTPLALDVHYRCASTVWLLVSFPQGAT